MQTASGKWRGEREGYNLLVRGDKRKCYYLKACHPQNMARFISWNLGDDIQTPLEVRWMLYCNISIWQSVRYIQYNPLINQSISQSINLSIIWYILHKKQFIIIVYMVIYYYSSPRWHRGKVNTDLRQSRGDPLFRQDARPSRRPDPRPALLGQWYPQGPPPLAEAQGVWSNHRSLHHPLGGDRLFFREGAAGRRGNQPCKLTFDLLLTHGIWVYLWCRWLFHYRFLRGFR